MAMEETGGTRTIGPLRSMIYFPHYFSNTDVRAAMELQEKIGAVIDQMTFDADPPMRPDHLLAALTARLILQVRTLQYHFPENGDWAQLVMAMLILNGPDSGMTKQ